MRDESGLLPFVFITWSRLVMCAAGTASNMDSHSPCNAGPTVFTGALFSIVLEPSDGAEVIDNCL